MQKPLEITFRGVPKMDAIEDLIQEKVAKLEKVCSYITSCSVAVERPQLYQKTGNPFKVRIDIRVPRNHEIVIRRECTEGDMHDSLQMVLRDAFKAARLALEDLVDKQHHDIKTHYQEAAVGVIRTLLPERGFGFIRTKDGRDIYFHHNSLVNVPFEKLLLGDSVRFSEEPGEKGPQATTVEVIQRIPAPVPEAAVVAKESE
jgi:cold shock CspA family protein/ribosome-associated translation inhibitor RaiA